VGPPGSVAMGEGMEHSAGYNSFPNAEDMGPSQYLPGVSLIGIE